MKELAKKDSGSRERSVVEILTDMVGNIQEIVRGEVRLAKTEIEDEAGIRWSSVRVLLVGAAIGLLSVACLLSAAVCALAMVMPAWAAAASVGLVMALVSGGLLAAGIRRWELHPVHQRGLEKGKGDVAWLKQQAR